MSEYIITDEQIAENQRLHGKKLLVMPVIVRCRDCEFFVNDGRWGVCTQFDFETTEENMRNGFCAWGERRDA